MSGPSAGVQIGASDRLGLELQPNEPYGWTVSFNGRITGFADTIPDALRACADGIERAAGMTASAISRVTRETVIAHECSTCQMAAVIDGQCAARGRIAS